MAKAVNLVGQRFGRLVVIERVPHYGTQAQAYWRCSCDCGGSTIVNGYGLRIRGTQSCGCLNREMLHMSVTKHGDGGETKKKLYKTWVGMKKRCYTKSTASYHNYGGRGIYVCNEWLHDYPAFKEWAYSNRFSETANRSEQQIDRIDNDGPYAPWNCRFATAKEQANNKRTRKFINVEQIDTDGNVVSVWPSARRAAASQSFCRTVISRACNNGRVAYGFMWRWQ